MLLTLQESLEDRRAKRRLIVARGSRGAAPPNDGMPFSISGSKFFCYEKLVRRSSKTRKSATTVLEREEWFFGKVPEDEILTCFYYKYA